MVLKNAEFAAFVPFAGEVPYEVWLAPRAHEADFGKISDSQQHSFAQALREILRRLYQKLGDPDYNYVIHSFPRADGRNCPMHWYLQLRPRLTTPAGFEMGSGICINPSLPEENAADLRKALKGDRYA